MKTKMFITILIAVSVAMGAADRFIANNGTALSTHDANWSTSYGLISRLDIQNNILTGPVGAAWTILSNLDKNQIALKVDMNNQFTEIKASIEKYKDKCDLKFTEHDQRITRCETKLESKK